jgi:hypothetical protein
LAGGEEGTYQKEGQTPLMLFADPQLGEDELPWDIRRERDANAATEEEMVALLTFCAEKDLTRKWPFFR